MCIVASQIPMQLGKGMDLPTITPTSNSDSTTEYPNPSVITNTVLTVAVPVTVLLLLLVVVVVIVTMLILWRCKHHTSHHTAKEEASHTTSHTHSTAAAAISLCEETGQVHYASLDQCTHACASIPSQASKGRAGPHEEQEKEEEEEAMGEYSMVNHGNKPPVTSGTKDPPLYAQVDKNPKNKDRKSTGS